MSLHKILCIFSIGCFITAGFLIRQRYNPSRLSFKKISYPINPNASRAGNIPISIIIKNLNINIPIVPAQIEKNSWETTAKGVSWLSSSPIPGNPGNSILYGHNWSNILGNLKAAKPGQEIRIIFADKSIKKFIINSIAVVGYDQATVLGPTNDIRMTLYTCTGFFDEKRLVITALLVL